MRSNRSDPSGGLPGQLVSELVDVPMLHELSGRHQLLTLIRRAVPGFADVAESRYVREHLIDIVLRCLSRPARLHVLAGALELMAPDDRAVQRIRSLVSGANVRDVLPEADLSEVRHLLERVRPSGERLSRFDAAVAESAWREPVPSAIEIVFEAARVANRPIAEALTAWADRQLDRLDLHYEPTLPDPAASEEGHEEPASPPPPDTLIPSTDDDGEEPPDPRRPGQRPIPGRVRFAVGASAVIVLVSLVAIGRCADLDARDTGRKAASTRNGAEAGSPSPMASSRSPSFSATPPSVPVGDVTLTLSTSGNRRCGVHVDNAKDMWLGAAVRLVETGKVPSLTAVTIASSIGETAFVSLNKENNSDSPYIYFDDSPNLRLWSVVVPAERVPVYLNKTIDLKVTVDPSDVVRETNEKNNTLTFRFVLPASIERVERADYQCSLVG